MTWILDPITVTREINYIWIIRTFISLLLAFILVYFLKDKRTLAVGSISILIGIIFECFALGIGLRAYASATILEHFLLIGLLGFEIGGATLIVLSIVTIIFEQKDGWVKKLLIWSGIVLLITIIIPLFVGA